MPNAEPPSPPSIRHTQTAMLAERAAVLLLLALLLYGVIRVLEPFGLAIAFGGFIAIGTWPLRDAMVRRGMPRGIAATVMLLLLILSLAIPALAVTPELGGQIAQASKVVRDLLASLPEAPCLAFRITAGGWDRSRLVATIIALAGRFFRIAGALCRANHQPFGGYRPGCGGQCGANPARANCRHRLLG